MFLIVIFVFSYLLYRDISFMTTALQSALSTITTFNHFFSGIRHHHHLALDTS